MFIHQKNMHRSDLASQCTAQPRDYPALALSSSQEQPAWHRLCRLYPQLAALDKNVPAILQPDTPLPDRFKTLDKPLAEYSIQAFESKLSLYKLSKSQYTALHQRARQVKLIPDPLLKKLTEPGLNKRVLEIQEQFDAQQPEHFSCPEFATTLHNMERIISFELTQPDCHGKPTLKLLLEQVQTLLASASEISYTQLHIISLQYIIIMDAYYADIENQKQSGLVEYNEMLCCGKFHTLTEFRHWLYNQEQFYLFSETLHILSHIIYTRNQILWPTFECVDARFFIESARYNFYILGILPGPMGFHDATIMRTEVFYRHDKSHASDTEPHCTDTLLKQRVLSLLRTTFSHITELTGNSNTEFCCWLLAFIAKHELSHCLLEIGKQEQTLLKEKCLAYIATGTFEFPPEVNQHHIRAAEECIEAVFSIDFHSLAGQPEFTDNAETAATDKA